MEENKTNIGKYVFGGVIGVLFLILFSSYINAYNLGNTLEQQIISTNDNNKNVLSTYYQKVQEVAQVPGMMKDDLKEVINGALASRYGNDGSKAVFNMIKENYPGVVDASLYQKIQQVVEAGRDEFKVAQTTLVDQKRMYKTFLGSFWDGFMLRVAGYPKINIGFMNGKDDYSVILTEQTENVFKTGKEADPIKLR